VRGVRGLAERVVARAGPSGSAKSPTTEPDTAAHLRAASRTRHHHEAHMKTPMIAGIILLVLGALVLVRGMSYAETHDVVKVGDMHITDTDSHGIPQWLGIAGVVGGVVLIGAGALKKK
jgi:hypothetical protein